MAKFLLGGRIICGNSKFKVPSPDQIFIFVGGGGGILGQPRIVSIAKMSQNSGSLTCSCIATHHVCGDLIWHNEFRIRVYYAPKTNHQNDALKNARDETSTQQQPLQAQLCKMTQSDWASLYCVAP